jgi:hypothetical protein
LAYKTLSLAAGLAMLTTASTFAAQADDGSAPAVNERPTGIEASAALRQLDPLIIMLGNDLPSGNVWEDRPGVQWGRPGNRAEKGP